jgi:hypothetical protein
MSKHVGVSLNLSMPFQTVYNPPFHILHNDISEPSLVRDKSKYTWNTDNSLIRGLISCSLIVSLLSCDPNAEFVHCLIWYSHSLLEYPALLRTL